MNKILLTLIASLVKRLVGAQHYATIYEVVSEAEKIAENEWTGSMKRDYVRNVLKGVGIQLAPMLINLAIESAVNALNTKK